MISTIIKAREIWLKNDTNAKLRTAMCRAPRKMPTDSLFLGQTVYFWQPAQSKLQKSEQKWRGPGVIIGLWGHQALIAFQMSFFRVANENLRTTNQLLEAIGSDEQLQIHSSGGEIPISEVVGGKTLMFLQRYKHLLEKGTKELSARQLRLQTLEPISNLKKLTT